MFEDLFGIGRKDAKAERIKKVAKKLKMDPSLLSEFEKRYDELPEDLTANIMKQNAKEAVSRAHEVDMGKGYAEDEGISDPATIERLTGRIVKELLQDASTGYLADKGNEDIRDGDLQGENKPKRVTKEEIMKITEKFRPQLSGNLYRRDIGGPPSYVFLLEMYQRFLCAKTKGSKKQSYHMFRQGLDMLDLDPVTDIWE